MNRTVTFMTIVAALLALTGICFADDPVALDTSDMPVVAQADNPAALDVGDMPVVAQGDAPAVVVGDAASDSDADTTSLEDEMGDDDDVLEATFRYLRAKYGTETLTDDWFGLGARLEEMGIVASLAFNQQYQINLEGGLSTHRRSGRWTGNYDFYADFDLEQLANIRGGAAYILVEGGWSRGLDPSSIGSAVGNVNANAGRGDEAVYISELWYQQGFFNNMLRIRLGKIDLTSGFETQHFALGFDQNAFAFDETSQFMNSALVSNPTIPFPGQGLGMMVFVQPTKWSFVAAGVADAQANATETGFNTTFHGEDYFFAIFETGLTPVIPSANGGLPGAYRVGFWYDPQDKPRLDGGGTERDDVGFYLSFDQVVYKESLLREDRQGLGMFARYGFAHSNVNAIKCFWSTGVQYEGLIPTRDEDVVAVGVAQGFLDSDAGHNKNTETVLEWYYNAQVTPWLNVSPSVQYIFNPGAVHGVSDAVVIGIRMQLFF